jgi:nucleoid-associated protein YgaU
MTTTTPGDDMPDFSNVESGASSTAEQAEPAYKTYEIQSGDSLSKIAKREYGNASGWHRIFEANRDTISDPDKIFPGQVIKIPL